MRLRPATCRLAMAFLLAAGCGLASAGAPGPAAADGHLASEQAGEAQVAEWDQERVTGIAQKLAKAVGNLRETVRREPDQPMGGARRAQHAVREDLRLLSNTTRELARQLEKGAGMEETLPVFHRIQSIRRDAQENGRKAMIPEDTMAKVMDAQDLLRQLRPYYEGEPAS